MHSVNSRAARSLATLAATVCLVGTPTAALAQAGGSTPVKSVSGLGYAFGGFGAATGDGESTGTYHLGGGGEAVFADAVGVGAEIGYLNAFEEGSEGFGVFSVNGTYHFGGGQPRPKLRPFVTGGYTLAFRDGHGNLFNLGGGVDYWLGRRAALRVELRDHIWSAEDVHVWEVRVGVTFR
jgi:hypothetical protein